jgi:small basic protein
MDKKKLILLFIWAPILTLGVLNLLTVFTPEIGFDALWYHLTLPKLWLMKQQWFFDGGLLYYSVMPRLTETIFIPLIKLTGYIGPKFVQYLSGVGISIIIWKISSKLKFSTLLKSVAVSLFYCTWLVSWQSGSAYIDLFRTFLETVALYFLISGSWIKGSLFLGLAVGTKWLALGSVAIYSLVFGAPIALLALLTSLPWFVISFVYTGNLVYPIFSPILSQSFMPIGAMLKNVLLLPLTVTLPYDDFLSPMVGILVMLTALSLLSRDRLIQKISLIGLLGSVISVVLNPPSSRFLLPYLPALVIASVHLIGKLKPSLCRIFIYLAIISSFVIVGLRCIAVKKYIPFLLGQESQTAFLTKHAGRLPDTFIDTDYYVRDQIPHGSKILIDKLHNLYYFPYDFDHTSWTKTTRDYDYLITTNTTPSEVAGELVHTNSLGIQIYRLNK